jgi:transposase
MNHLDDISVEDLHDALDTVDGKKQTQRLLAAIAYKNGVTQTELAEWHGVQRKTIYNWLKRLDSGSLEQAVTDDHSPGRPRRLSQEQQNRLEEILRQPPTDVGYDAPAWTTALLSEFLEDHFDVSYSQPSCRRFMREAGLRYQKPRRTAAEADEKEKEAFHDDLKKSEKRWTSP